MRDAVISPRICVAFVYTEAVVGKQDPWRRPVCLQNDLQENMKYSGTASKPAPALYLTLSGQTDRQTDRQTHSVQHNAVQNSTYQQYILPGVQGATVA